MTSAQSQLTALDAEIAGLQALRIPLANQVWLETLSAAIAATPDYTLEFSSTGVELSLGKNPDRIPAPRIARSLTKRQAAASRKQVAPRPCERYVSVIEASRIVKAPLQSLRRAVYEGRLLRYPHPDDGLDTFSLSEVRAWDIKRRHQLTLSTPSERYQNVIDLAESGRSLDQIINQTGYRKDMVQRYLAKARCTNPPPRATISGQIATL